MRCEYVIRNTMSQENISNFFSEIPRNPGLQGRLRKISTQDPEETLLEVLSSAKEEGYYFSLEELKLALKNESNLEDDDLKAVFGGKGSQSPLSTWVGPCRQ